MIEGRLPILIHMGDERYDYSSPLYLKQALKDFPKLKVIAAHLGGYQRWEEAIECLGSEFENLRYDTSSSLSLLPEEYSKQLISHYGLENCFFGTDFPMWNHQKELNALFNLDYSYEDYKKLLSQNFKDFFNL